MNYESAISPCPTQTRDREVIRVDFTNDKLGIAASLRQAFGAASQDQCTRDLEKLLSELD